VVDVVQEKEAVLCVSAVWCKSKEDQQQTTVIEEPHVKVIDMKTGTIVVHLG
jgi:hypothetical protein